MTDEQIKELREKVYKISNSYLPLNVFFNDIGMAGTGYDKRLAYADLNLIVNYINEQKDRLDKLEKVIEILSCILELPEDDDIALFRKDINFYRLSTRCLINEEELELLKEVLNDEKC